MKKVLRFKNREDWLSSRSKGIGASEAGTVLGLNPFETPWQLWARKRGMVAPQPENQAMRMGHHLEGVVASLFEEETNNRVMPSSVPDFQVVDDRKPWLRVSPDRYYRTCEKGEKCILECKTTARAIDHTDLPKHWVCQVQMLLAVTGCKHGALAWLVNGREFGYVDVDYSPEFWEWLEPRLTSFWNDNVLKGIEPEVTSVADVLAKYPHEEEGKHLCATPLIERSITELHEIRESVKQLEENADLITDSLKQAMGDCESIIGRNGDSLVTWKTSKPSRRVNVQKLKDMGMYDHFTTEVQGTRRFVLKKLQK